jgi:hypothetical protein
MGRERSGRNSNLALALRRQFLFGDTLLLNLSKSVLNESKDCFLADMFWKYDG